jgi:hypothetical protein
VLALGFLDVGMFSNKSRAFWTKVERILMRHDAPRFSKTFVLLLLAGGLFLSACDDSSMTAPETAPEAERDGQARTTGITDPEKGPIQTGYVIGKDGETPVKIGYQVVDGNAIWDGDIGLGSADQIASTPEEAMRQQEAEQKARLSSRRPEGDGVSTFAFHYNGSSYWSDTGGVIPVRRAFNPNNLTAALNQIERQVPGVEFVPYNGQSHYVEVRYGNGANYYNGCTGGRCDVYIGSSAKSKQLIMHEFGHALGFQHEQKRCDRNSYIDMIYYGDTEGIRRQFYRACGWEEIGSYDLYSIMHYNSREFGDLHFTAENGNEVCGYWCRTNLSSKDVAAWRQLYPASGNGRIIIDSNDNNNGANADHVPPADWNVGSYGSYYGTGYYWHAAEASSDAVTFRFYLESAERKTVYAWWTGGSNRTSAAPYIAYNSNGTKLGTIYENQRANGGQWNGVGTWNFTAGWNEIKVSHWTGAEGMVVADAVMVE